jgi:hypothetical protein
MQASESPIRTIFPPPPHGYKRVPTDQTFTVSMFNTDIYGRQGEALELLGEEL